MMLAAEIPDGYLIAIIPVLLTVLFGFIGWMVSRLLKVSENDAAAAQNQVTTAATLERIERRLDNHAQRLRELERLR